MVQSIFTVANLMNLGHMFTDSLSVQQQGLLTQATVVVHQLDDLLHGVAIGLLVGSHGGGVFARDMLSETRHDVDLVADVTEVLNCHQWIIAELLGRFHFLRFF